MGVNYRQPVKSQSGIIITDQELLQMIKYFRKGDESLANTAKRLLARAISNELGMDLQASQRSVGRVMHLHSLARR